MSRPPEKIVIQKMPAARPVVSGTALDEVYYLTEEVIDVDREVIDRLSAALDDARRENLQPGEILCGRRAFLSLYCVDLSWREGPGPWRVVVGGGRDEWSKFEISGMRVRYVREFEPDQILFAFGGEAVR